jgi:PhoPQ-activated pathogenicity-related protein
MAKAVIKSMDVLQAFAKQEQLPELEGFLVCGASKRGWTTWLVGASKDPRVKAIAPMVIDCLNLPKQSEHQLASYGKPSEQVRDYTGAGMLEVLKTPAGKRLVELEDPYSYRDRYKLPKLIINGTNDRYWTQDALNLYWDDLPAQKWVLYVPNSGHKLEDRGRVLATLGAFARFTAAGKTFPALSWKYEAQPDGTFKLSLESDHAIEEARLFAVNAKTKDFRDSRWSFALMTGDKNAWSAPVTAPAEGFRAVYGEAVFEIEGAKFTLSTQIKILGAPTPAPPTTETPATPAPAPETKKPVRWY